MEFQIDPLTGIDGYPVPACHRLGKSSRFRRNRVFADPYGCEDVIAIRIRSGRGLNACTHIDKCYRCTRDNSFCTVSNSAQNIRSVELAERGYRRNRGNDDKLCETIHRSSPAQRNGNKSVMTSLRQLRAATES